MKFKHILWGVGTILFVVSILGLNGAIYYSSVPHNEQMGWAEFCGCNAIWIFLLGVFTLVYSDSYDLSMRQLNWDERNKAKIE